MFKEKPFHPPDISLTVQDLLEKVKKKGEEGAVVVDVGANVGMASFAAVAMGFPVLAFAPVFDRVTILAAAATDRHGNITLHKLVGRLDNRPWHTSTLTTRSSAQGSSRARLLSWTGC